MDYLSKLHQKDVQHFFAIYVCQLTSYDLELKLTLKIIFNHSNNTIIGFVSQNPIKRGITHIPSFIC